MTYGQGLMAAQNLSLYQRMLLLFIQSDWFIQIHAWISIHSIAWQETGCAISALVEMALCFSMRLVGEERFANGCWVHGWPEGGEVAISTREKTNDVLEQLSFCECSFTLNADKTIAKMPQIIYKGILIYRLTSNFSHFYWRYSLLGNSAALLIPLTLISLQYTIHGISAFIN